MVTVKSSEVTQSIPSPLRAAPGSRCSQGSAGCRRFVKTCCRAGLPRRSSGNCTAPQHKSCPFKKALVSQVARVLFSLVAFFSLGIAFLQFFYDFLAPSFKNLVLRSLIYFILFKPRFIIFSFI